MAVFRSSNEGILARRERNRQYMKEYYNRPGARERRKQYRQKPKIREQIKQWGREYRQRPEVKERKRRYFQRPEVKEQRNRRAKLRRKELKSILFQFFGGKCSHCGCDDLRALEINHVNGGGSKEHQLRGGYVFYADILSGKRKTDDLELLCTVCNAHHHIKVLKGVSGDWKIEWKPHNKGGEMLG